MNGPGSCYGNVNFKPTALGLRSGTLATSFSESCCFSFTFSGSGNYLTKGKGLPPGPNLSFKLSPLSAGANGATTSLYVTPYNSGSTTLTLNPPTLSGPNAAEFTATSCPATLAPGATCNISVTVTPTQYGLRSANVSFTDTTSGQVFTQALSFISNYAAPTVSQPAPASTAFASHVNGTSAPLNESVARPIADPVTIAMTSGAFTVSNNGCAANAACSFDITFAPTAATTYTSTATVTDTYTGLSTTIPLTATGGLATATIFPQSLTFPSTAVGSTSAAQTVSVQNTGDAALNMLDMLTGTNASDFILTNNYCSGQFAINASCTVSVSFAPKTSGAKSAGFSFSASSYVAANLPFTIPLTATAP